MPLIPILCFVGICKFQSWIFVSEEIHRGNRKLTHGSGNDRIMTSFLSVSIKMGMGDSAHHP